MVRRRPLTSARAREGTADHGGRRRRKMAEALGGEVTTGDDGTAPHAACRGLTGVPKRSSGARPVTSCSGEIQGSSTAGRGFIWLFFCRPGFAWRVQGVAATAWSIGNDSLPQPRSAVDGYTSPDPKKKPMARRLKAKALTLKKIARDPSCSLPLVTANV